LDEIAISHIPSIPFSSIPVLLTFLLEEGGGAGDESCQGLKNHFILFFKSKITVINDKETKQRMFWSPGGHNRLGQTKKKKNIMRSLTF